ncbi:rhs element Vgr protein [Streptomyces viridochromogenes DSM 40736]|uniref:Rhs element Vgr protein n=1 Tax=Streptomyces viridochromogenes (strain DSM 40736 / JCM 4977 / BCRC 1201 / Tue 494) TaxID=591159 RepID=D9XJ62_STRVT|nr:VgrG-related protein [Streptomyces viridochromogenes]EFL35177.1 rhs element Vgr protein [Streptomyces viridochromogenes DSM 40736]
MVQSAFSSVVDVKIGGAPLPPEFAPDLVESYVDQGVGVPAAFRLTFRDPYRLLLGKLKITFGTEVVFAPVADGEGAGDPLLTGEVTGLEADYDGTGSYTVVRGYDVGHRLLRQRRVAAYRNQSASDIARKLAGKDDVPIGRIESTKTVYEFISQSNVTDWDFLARLADENEMVMSVDADGKFQFVKPKSASGAPSPGTDGDKSPFVLQGGHDILRLRAAVTAADQVAKVEARGWDVTTKTKLTATAAATGNPGITIGTTPGAAAGKFKAAKLVETGTPYDKQNEVRFAADALADDVTGSFAELEVVARGNPKLRPGVPVALADVGEPFEGKYTVTSVRHDFGDGKHYEAWVTVSGRQWRSLYGLASGGGSQTAPRMPSVANALVTDVNDPLKQGRVRLQFPWLDDRYVSDWTRTVQMGGLGGGGVFPMDVNDEVLVAFDRGALDHPFVIGGLYNGRDKPTPVGDVPLHDAVRKKASRHTVSDRDGNRMDLLSQKTGLRKQGVRLASGDKQLTINLDRTKTEIVVDSKGSVTIKGSRSVSVEAGTDLTLSARRSVNIKSGGLVNIQGRGLVNLKSLGGAVTVDAMGALNLKALGAATFTAGGTVQVNTVANVGIRAITIALQGAVLVNSKPYPLP